MRLFSLLLVFGAMVLISGGAPSSAAPSFVDKILGFLRLKMTRDRCISLAGDYLRQIPVNDQVMAYIKEAREYYYKEVEADYKPPRTPEFCRDVVKMCHDGPDETNCVDDESIMGKNETQNFLDMINTSEHAKLVAEAVYACKDSHISGRKMREVGIFDAIVSRA